ncbi:uncharacterized protein LOC116061933 [Sander lucioperca]|uniref:uncharacterized protein LOC116061933 n=1 Tax=Sander lucioperca TaxID=283035 RepID=UPI001653D08E|nr:uncharacterized protein LOC116061933 [Sander lucioperca]
MCHRSLRKKERPHNLRIVLEDSSPVQLYETVCSCAAGKALCNHTVALLFQTATYSQLRLLAVPPVLSCTETEQRWHKPRTMGVKPGRVSDMVVMSAKPKQRTVASGVRSTLYKAMRGDMPDPDVLKVTEAYEGFSPDIAPLITTMSISAGVPLVESALGKVQEGSLISYQQPVPASRIPSAFGWLQIGAHLLPVCMQSPPATASAIYTDQLGNGKGNRSGNKGPEYVCGVASGQKDEINIFSL